MTVDLVNIDCMEYMKGCEDNSFDLCITSPPYNIGAKHHTGNIVHSPYKDDYPEKDYQESQILMLDELYRITANTGSLFYNHKNRIKNGSQISPYEWLFKTKWIVKQEIVWINGSQNLDKIRFFPMTERVYWLVKDPATKCKNVAGLKDYILQGEWGSVPMDSNHSRAFPLKMVEDILQMFPDTKTMFDPYSGSATSAIASHYFGVDFVGCELDKDYYDAACERFDRETKQKSMF